MASKTTTTRLKYEYLNDLEFISILKNKKSVLELDKKECKDLEGKSWREFQTYLGDNIPPGKYYFTIKFKNNPELYRGTTRAISKNNLIGEEPELSNIETQLKNLEERLNQAQKNGGIPYELLLESTKSGFQARIDYLNERIKDKDIEIARLKDEIAQLEKELDKAQIEYNKVSANTGWVAIFDKYAPLIEQGLIKLGARQQPKLGLQDAPVDASGIPNEVIQILAQVDYDELKKVPDKYEQILTMLRQYVTVLPQKKK